MFNCIAVFYVECIDYWPVLVTFWNVQQKHFVNVYSTVYMFTCISLQASHSVESDEEFAFGLQQQEIAMLGGQRIFQVIC